MDVAEEEDWAPLSAEVFALLERRDAARQARDWETSDRLREEIAAAGVAVEDTTDGQRWRRIKERARG
jgi:cysteinyl-tRNA synthetase